MLMCFNPEAHPWGGDGGDISPPDFVLVGIKLPISPPDFVNTVTL
jgi:hypothetical protein